MEEEKNPLDDLLATVKPQASVASPSQAEANPLDDILPPAPQASVAPPAEAPVAPQTHAQGRTEDIVDESGNFTSVPVSDQYEAPAVTSTAPPEGEVADLPDPEGIFEGLDFDSQKKLYGAYAKHPKSQQTENGLVYDGKRVEPPTKSGGQMATDIVTEAGSNASGVGKGVINAGTNVVELGLAGADKLNELEGRGQSTLAKDFRTAVPEFKGKDATQQFFVDIGEMGAGAIGGIGIASKVNQVANLGKIARAATTFIGGNVGPGLTQSADNPLLMTGENSLSEKLIGKSLPALGTDKDGTYSDNLLRKRFDLVTDSIGTGAVAGVAASGAGKLGKLVMGATIDKIKNFVSLDLRQKNMVLDFLDTVAGIDPEKQLTAAEKAPLRQKALEMLDDETRFKLESGNVDLGDIDVNRRTVHAADRSGISPEALTQIQDMEGSVRQKSLGPLDRADAQVGDALHEGTETMLKNEGGNVVEGVPENINKARDTVQTEARNESTPFHETANEAEQMATGSQQALEADIKTNKVIGDRATELENAGPEALQKEFATRDTNITKIDKEFKAKAATLDAELEKRTEAIPEGLGMNNPNEILAKTQELADSGIVSKKFLQKVTDATSQGPAGLKSIDYKKLTAAIKQLKYEKDKAFQNPNVNAVGDLQDLDELIKVNTPKDESINNWNNFYENDWAPVQRSDVTGDLRTISKDNRLSPAKEAAGRKETISKATEQPDLTKQMADVLANPKTGSGSSQHLLDATLADDVTDEVATHIANGGVLSEISADKLSAGLKKRMAQINATNPEMGKELTTLFKRIKDGQIDIKKFGEEAKVARKAQEDADLEIFGNNFKDFFEGGGTGKPYKNTEDALKAFDDVLDKGQSSKLKNVVNAVNRSGDESAKRGLRAAYIRKFRERLFDKTKRQKGATKGGLASDRPALKSNETATFAEGDDLYQAGLEIFKDEPQALEFIAGLTKEASDASKLATNTGAELAAANKASKAGSIQGVGRLITWTLGVLNPAATRAKTITSAAIDAMDPEDKLRIFSEYILSDASNFSKEAKKYMAKDAGAASPEMKAFLRKSMVKAGIRAPMSDDKDYTKTQKKNLMSK